MALPIGSAALDPGLTTATARSVRPCHRRCWLRVSQTQGQFQIRRVVPVWVSAMRSFLDSGSATDSGGCGVIPAVVDVTWGFSLLVEVASQPADGSDGPGGDRGPRPVVGEDLVGGVAGGTSDLRTRFRVLVSLCSVPGTVIVRCALSLSRSFGCFGWMFQVHSKAMSEPVEASIASLGEMDTSDGSPTSRAETSVPTRRGTPGCVGTSGRVSST